MLRRPDFGTTPGAKGRPGAAKKALSEEQKLELSEAFQLFDSEKTGRIDYHELKVAMRSLGFEVKKAEVVALMEEHDVARSGSIGYDEAAAPKLEPGPPADAAAPRS